MTALPPKCLVWLAVWEGRSALYGRLAVVWQGFVRERPPQPAVFWQRFVWGRRLAALCMGRRMVVISHHKLV